MIKTTRNLLKFCTENSNKLGRFQNYSQFEAKQLMRKENPLRDIIMQEIDRFGELKMDKYWKLALTDPDHGYYSINNVFSREGDFTTSPEISPLFGEMIAIWIIYFLKQTGIIDKQTNQINKRFRLIELGGGRGLLMKDIINSFRDIKIANNFEINFVEVSQYNRKSQQDSVQEAFKLSEHFFRFQHEVSNDKYQSFCSENPDRNVNLKWFDSLEAIFYQDSETTKNNQQVPFTVFVMNQFMDALPTVTLQYTSNGWKQKVFVRSMQQELYVELGVSAHQLPQKLTPPTVEQTQLNQELEISPQSCLTIDLMAKMILKCGGCIINADYGDDGHFQNSIRGIKEHKYVPSPYFWQIPGECDLSAYVNFGALAQFAEKNQGIIAFELVPQGYFLQAMGIVHRVDMLKQKADEQTKKRLDSEQQRLVDPKQMGQIYKVQIITKKQYGELYPFIQIDQNSF